MISDFVFNGLGNYTKEFKLTSSSLLSLLKCISVSIKMPEYKKQSFYRPSHTNSLSRYYILGSLQICQWLTECALAASVAAFQISVAIVYTQLAEIAVTIDLRYPGECKSFLADSGYLLDEAYWRRKHHGQ